MPPFCFFIQTQGHGDILNFPSLTPAIPALSLCLIVFHFNNALRIVSSSQGICIVLNPSKYLHCSLTPTLYQFYLSSATIKKRSFSWTDNFVPFIKSFCLTPASNKTEWKIFMLTWLNLRPFFSLPCSSSCPSPQQYRPC